MSTNPSLSSRELATRLGVTPETVRRWCRDGRLVPAGVTPGGQLRFSEDQVRLALGGPAPAERALDLEAHVRAQAERAVARLRVLRKAR